jgi:hypothetical protein
MLNIKNENSSDYLLYPNPANSILNVSNFSNEDSYKICNSIGQEINLNTFIPNEDNSISIDVSSLSSRIYYMSFQKKSETFVKKFIKQ